jgi:hypothetical protein
MKCPLHDKIDSLSTGIYDALLDERLRDTLKSHPEVRTVFSKLDPEEQPTRYAAFIAKVIEQVLRQEDDPSVSLL